MAVPARKLATYEDLLALPEGIRAELINGVVIIDEPDTPTDGGARMMSPSPLPRHGKAQASVTALLTPPFEFGSGGPGGWWILNECDVAVTPFDVVTPDVLGYRRARMPDFPQHRPLTLAPDWVCEILSPSTQQRDRSTKAELYHLAGVRWYWLIDPAARLLEAFERAEGGWLRLGAWTDGQSPEVAPFDAIALPLARLFPPEPRPPTAAEAAAEDVGDLEP